MGYLLDDLIAAGKQLPPSHVPSPHDFPTVLGALVAYIERGQPFLEDFQAGADSAQLVSGKPADEGSGPQAGPGYTVLQGTVQPAIEPPVVQPDPVLTVQSDPVTAPQLDPAQVVAPALPAPAAPAEAGGAAPLSADEVQTLQSLLTRMSATDPPYVTTEPPA